MLSSIASDAMCDSGMSTTHEHVSRRHYIGDVTLTVYNAAFFEVFDVGVEVIEEAHNGRDVIAQALVSLRGRLWWFREVVDCVCVHSLTKHSLAETARRHGAPLQHRQTEFEESEAWADCGHVTRHR